MRPALKAGLLPVWRDRETLQFGVDPRRAVAVSGLGQTAAVLSLLDGSRDRDGVIAAAQAYGVGPEAAGHVLAVLAAAGVLDDFPSRLHASLPAQLRARLAPELAAASLAYADGDGGARSCAGSEACSRAGKSSSTPAAASTASTWPAASGGTPHACAAAITPSRSRLPSSRLSTAAVWPRPPTATARRGSTPNCSVSRSRHTGSNPAFRTGLMVTC